MNTSGIIELSGMEFFSYHGCFDEERMIGNKYIVDLSVRIYIGKAGESDCLDDTVDYQKLYGLVKKEMAINSNLLEHVAMRILTRIESVFKEICWAEIKISKLNPPIGGKVAASKIIYSSSFE